MDLKTEIVRRLDALPPERQGDVLAFVDRIGQTLTRGTPGSQFLPFFGTLDDVSAKEMREAIEADCERIDRSES